ncbi:MAG TPA: hypothetical protein VFF57_01625, partial [Hanamia sp.]|nr:hypothetical protein [Hanamia sp.]
DEKNAQLHERRVAAESTKKAVKNIQSKVEKTTLGDLGVLADLKKKMDQAPEAEVKAKADEAPTEAPVAKKEASKSKADAEEASNEEEKPKAEKKAEGTLAQTPPPPANEPQHIKAQAEAAAEKEEAEAEDAQDEDASEEEKA